MPEHLAVERDRDNSHRDHRDKERGRSDRDRDRETIENGPHWVCLNPRCGESNPITPAGASDAYGGVEVCLACAVKRGADLSHIRDHRDHRDRDRDHRDRDSGGGVEEVPHWVCLNPKCGKANPITPAGASDAYGGVEVCLACAVKRGADLSHIRDHRDRGEGDRRMESDRKVVANRRGSDRAGGSDGNSGGGDRAGGGDRRAEVDRAGGSGVGDRAKPGVVIEYPVRVGGAMDRDRDSDGEGVESGPHWVCLNPKCGKANPISSAGASDAFGGAEVCWGCAVKRGADGKSIMKRY
jgi:hypothetical protein